MTLRFARDPICAAVFTGLHSDDSHRRRGIYMRHLLPLAFVGAAISVLGAQDISPLDVPIPGEFRVVDPALRRGPCSLWTAVEQVARQGRVRVGFENTPDCHPGATSLSAGDGALQLDGSTPREAFDHLIVRYPTFRWHELDGVVVMRPVSAWENPAAILHRPVSPFAVDDVHVHYAMHAVLESAKPTLFQPHNRAKLSVSGKRLLDPSAAVAIDAPVSVRFDGGTLLEALNAVTTPHGRIWQVGYLDDRLYISLQTLVFSEGVTTTVSAPIR